MNYQEWNDLGEKIQEIIDSAVNEQNYRKLNQNINQTVNRAFENGSEALRDALDRIKNEKAPERKPEAGPQKRPGAGYAPKTERTQERKPVEKEKNQVSLYGKTSGEQVKGILMTTFGGILTGGMGLGCLITGITALVMGASAGMGGTVLQASAFLGTAAAGGGILLTAGIRSLCRLSRFKRYVKALGNHTYCDFRRLAQAAGKPVKFVKKDIKTMIARGWFLEGHVDEQKTCLITSDETYQQYMATQKALEEKERKAIPEAEPKKTVSPEVQEVLNKGNAFLLKIRQSNDAIPGEEISGKISRMELIVEKIFERVKAHPEIIPDLERMMDYYLPMTVKLLDAYEDMDSQPVEGENIRSSKREIEETIDTLNAAFEKLFDSVFQDTAWDVSSDISVLHTVLAQEGLTEDAFTKMKRNAAAKEKV